MSNENKTNRVMVVGSGVAGINAAVELAERGYPVSLVEGASTLGGLVTRLHRLYPLCSCCKLGDRVTVALEHPNIQVLTDSQVEKVDGKAGNFTVTVSTRGNAQQIPVGSIILAPGVEPFDPSAYDTYSYSEYPNVITSLEFEAMQKPAGPTKGVVQRPSDGKVPQRVAWLQCVGSRDINRCDASYCSSVCCMYALKESVNLLDAIPQAAADIYYMDIRTHGKDYEDYLEKAKAKGVRLIRSRVHTIDKVAGSDDLRLRWMPSSNGETMTKENTYDMVVLSVGLRPSAGTAALAEKLGVKLAADRFVSTSSLKSVESSVPGIFVCGGASGPEDVHDSIVQAVAAVSKAGEIVKSELSEKALPPLRDLSQEAARIGVVFALCPNKSAEFESLVTDAGHFAVQLPSVAAVRKVETSNGSLLQQVAEFVQSEKLNRLVFGSCSPSMHKEAVETALRQAGLNPYVYDMVDLRVMGAGNGEQLNDHLRLTALKLQLLDPPTVTEIPVSKRVLVIGGGLAGMESALSLASQGAPVTLVEKEAQLGGHALKVRATWQGESVHAYAKELAAKVQGNSLITVLTAAKVQGSQGFQGNFTTTVAQNGKAVEVNHGAVVIATGGHASTPSEYLYGSSKKVYNWPELSEKLIKDPDSLAKASSAVFIQCVGSREPQHPYCSRICCTFAVSAALALKEKNPDMNIYILYRDMRTFGKREDLYAEARKQGVIFVRYDLESKPVVSENGGGLQVKVFDPILQRDLQIPADFVSLQSAIEPTCNEKLSQLFHVALDSNGFIDESPLKMKPVDSTVPGVLAAGLALAPKGTEQNVAEGWAAASRALNVVSKDKLLVGGLVASVKTDLCAACLVCVRTCPFEVPYVKPQEDAFFKGAAYIDPGKCQGCGMCVSECPAKAIEMTLPSDAQIQALTEALFTPGSVPQSASKAR